MLRCSGNVHTASMLGSYRCYPCKNLELQNEVCICNPIVKSFFFSAVLRALWKVCTKTLTSDGNMISNIVTSNNLIRAMPFNIHPPPPPLMDEIS